MSGHGEAKRAPTPAAPLAYDLSFACPACGEPSEVPLTEATEGASCAHCEARLALPEAAATVAHDPISPCPVCGGEDLYWQRDFNRKVGMFIVVIGCALGPFTSWISVVVAVVIDALLYLLVPDVTVCYACNAQFRDVPKARRPGAFDVAIHDVYKFGKRFPPRREAAVAGPYLLRERLEAAKEGREVRLYRPGQTPPADAPAAPEDESADAS